jgi:hypothetical protein
VAFEIKQGDQRPLFVVVLKDDFGEVSESIVDLTTAGHASGTALFNMRGAGGASGTAVKVSRGTATITNAAGGEVTYAWGTADTTLAGDFHAEIEIIWNDGKPETFPGGPGGGSYWDVTITDDIA